MSSVKKICTCAFCVALSYVLPLVFHAAGLGMAFSPLHFPALLCGLLCGWPYGALCGIVGPILSSVLSGMPAASQLIYMCPEVCVYGLVTGLGMRFIRTGRTAADIYLSMVPALLLGRVAGGVVRAVAFLSNAQSYTIAMWASAYVVGTTPAMVMQLVVLPVLVLALTRAGLIPQRYSKTVPAA
ncbi:MAG: ECF transporter S component [Oscillospiraceae bacterium]|nr:ECF transporter S component [Oscillospiraceae bacterium]